MNSFKVDTQEYAFVVQKNSLWLSRINSAISVAINIGVVSKSYHHHLNRVCPAAKRAEKLSLTLENLGILFIVATFVAIVLSILKVGPRFFERNRPRLPMTVIGQTNEQITCNRYVEKNRCVTGSLSLGLQSTRLWRAVSFPSVFISPTSEDPLQSETYVKTTDMIV